ncbi:MAG: tRNA epoxyqueuosine(34) reductase QueG [Anaerolineae bacterium]|nr:tRNA epoxyqueuosine(34) reductase QueG [Anaerolineae bacterium]
MTISLTQQIKEKAYDLGFDLIGVAPADRAPHADAFRRWVAQGHAAEMKWLSCDPHRRENPRLVLPHAQSVVVVGLSYFLLDPPPELWNDPSRGRIARYAWGLDYHSIMLPRLHELGDFAEREIGHSLNQRAYVDTGPVLERDFAAQAGLGFIGKNTMLIHPKIGSYLFLGEILIDRELAYDEPAIDNGASCQTTSPGQPKRVGTCGNCTRCLETCPTHALPAPYILDSNRCISYLTIELKGKIPIELRPLLGNWIFGCDACQEICPWVRRYAQPTREKFLSYNPEFAIPKLTDLMRLDDAAFRARFKGTPLQRAKRRGLLRNVAVALSNGGGPEALPILEQTVKQEPEPLIREHALWAIKQIQVRLNRNNPLC